MTDRTTNTVTLGCLVVGYSLLLYHF